VSQGNIGVVLPDYQLATERVADEGKVYELIIIGGGPAGLTAGVYAARKRMDVLLLTQDIGGQVMLTGEIENYMGYERITGEELIARFKEQLSHQEITVQEESRVASITRGGKVFIAYTDEGYSYRARTVIIASGKRSRPLDVPGEERLVGRGVSYCAVCDAPLFAGRDVAVVGGGNSGLTAAIDLIKIANKVYVVSAHSSLPGDPVLVEQVEQTPQVDIFVFCDVQEVLGRERVTGIRIRSRQEEEERTLPVQGVFVEKGFLPNSELAQDIVKLSEDHEIIIDPGCRTSVPGIFAAGDVTTVPEKQIIISAGEGAKAALSAYNYLITTS
jgi:alkyl hydroperoxide reductase subunit F